MSRKSNRIPRERRAGSGAKTQATGAPDSAAPAISPEPKKVLAGHRWWPWALLLAVLTIFAYAPAWHAGYIWDDDKYVTANPLLTAPDGLKRIWFSLDSPSQYFPLVYTTFRIEHALWGLQPAGYHWVNILLHAANALLVWRLLFVLRVPGAWLGAALFALHPVHVESVAWITERKNVLMGLFFLLALLAWIRFTEEKLRARWRFYAAALVLYALAIFSKTTACTLPAALLLVLWLRHRTINLARLAQVTPFVLLGLGMGLLTIWWERNIQGTQGELFSMGMLERILVASRATFFYLWKLLWPANLAFSYPRWSISATEPLDYLWVVAIVALSIAIYFARRSAGRGVAAAMVFFAATLSPMLGFVMLYTFRYTFVADHYQYLASIGPLALVAAGLSLLHRRARVLSLAACAILLLGLAGRTWSQAGIYENEETLWKATIATNPDSWMAHNNLAIQFVQSGRVEAALPHYERAIQLNPQYAEGHYNLGTALVRLGQPNEAINRYRRAVELFPGYASAHSNLANVLAQTGRLNESVAHFSRALELNPNNVAAHAKLGDVFARLGRKTEAVASLHRAVAIDPTDLEAQSNLGRTLAETGRVKEGLVHLRRAVEINPADANAQNSLGTALSEAGQIDEAIEHLRRALEADPAHAQAHYNLGTALLRQARFEQAIAEYQRALEVRPDYAAAHLNLGNVLAQTGRMEEAVQHYERALAVQADYAAAHNNLGRALLRLGRSEEAEAHLRRAHELSR